MNASGNTVAVETFRIRRSIIGYLLVPEGEPGPLLLGMVDGDRALINKPLEWDSLKDGIERVRNACRERGLVATMCGDLKRSPVVKLRCAKPRKEEPRQVLVFQGLRGGDAAHRGVEDFYEEHRIALAAALGSCKPFTTGWYSDKHSGAGARISRVKTNGPITLEVSVSADEPADLVDTALWKAAGGNGVASCGREALERLGLNAEECDDVLDRMVEGYAQGEWSSQGSAALHWKSGMDRVCSELSRLQGNLDEEMEAEFEGLVTACAWALKELKNARSASCGNCAHFWPGTRDGRTRPGDADECGHPKIGAMVSRGKNFPFANGCKHWLATSWWISKGK